MSSEFRLRGREMTRLETFVDAAFAFALTLLVISFDEIPSNFAELEEALRGAPAFAASFAVLCMLWVAHREWSQRFGLEDAVSTLLSFALVFVVLIYVYPLKVLMAAVMHGITGGWAPSNFRLESYGELRMLLLYYGLGFAAANAILVLLNLHALRLADRLGLDDFERFETRATIGAWAIVGGSGLVSALAALSLPDERVTLASWLYMSLAVIMPVYGILADRRGRRIHGGSN